MQRKDEIELEKVLDRELLTILEAGFKTQITYPML